MGQVIVRDIYISNVLHRKCLKCGDFFPLEKRKRVMTTCEGCTERHLNSEKEKVKEFERMKELFFEANKEYLEEKRKRKSFVMRRNNHLRKSREKELVADLSVEGWKSAIKAFDGECAYCGKTEKLTQDHFIPVSKGGGYTAKNIIPACQWCNSSKNDKDFSVWYPKREFYSEEREKKVLDYIKKL